MEKPFTSANGVLSGCVSAASVQEAHRDPNRMEEREHWGGRPAMDAATLTPPSRVSGDLWIQTRQQMQ